MSVNERAALACILEAQQRPHVLRLVERIVAAVADEIREGELSAADIVAAANGAAVALAARAVKVADIRDGGALLGAARRHLDLLFARARVRG